MGSTMDLNRTGTDGGYDPMTGYLKALSNSPDAATDFFNQEFVGKDDDRKEALSNFQYLFEEREWPQGMNDVDDRASRAGTTSAWHWKRPRRGIQRANCRQQTHLPTTKSKRNSCESLVSSVSGDNERLTKHGYMSDSIGQITSEYLPDINRAMTDDSDSDTNRLFPVAGSSATLNHRDVTALLVSVGQNPEGYAAVEVGNKNYMANLMDYHMNPDLPADDRYSKDTQFAIEQLAHGSGEISGTLAIGRQEAVAGPAAEKDDAYDHAVSQWKNGISGAVGTGIGVGTTFIASPVGGAAAGGAADTVSSMILEELFQNAEGHAKDKAGPVLGEKWENGLDENASYTEKAAELAAKAHHRTDLQDMSIDEKARAATQQGFRDAGTNTEYMAPHLKTDI